MSGRLLRKPVATVAACWLLGVALYAATEPLWLAAGFVVFLLTPLAAVAVYGAAGARLRSHRLAGFTVTAGAFTNRPWRPVAAMSLAAGHLAGPGLVTLPSASGPLDVVLSLMSAPVLGFGLIIGATVAPTLVLSPAGLECRGVGWPATSWDGVGGAEHVTDGPRASRGVRLTLLGPYGRQRTEVIPRGFDLDYSFLTATIRYYLAHPEHRTAIGTDAELVRLVSAVAADGHGRPLEVTGAGA